MTEQKSRSFAGGNQRRSSGNRSSHSQSGRPGGRRRFSSRRKKPANKIDVSLFINKAEPIAEQTPYVSKHKFKDFAVDRQLIKNMEARGYEAPTEIQDKTIPLILENHDVIGLSNTGTGKTAAFLLPLMHKILCDRRAQVIILAPTRELATQIEAEITLFTQRRMGIYSTLCVGGTYIGRQIRDLKKHIHFVVGTPGRVMDLMEKGALNLTNTKYIVLDEADRMLDMGFIGDMRYIMTHMPKERQTLFFSATMSDEIKKLVGEFLHGPETVSVIQQNTSRNVNQDVVHTRGQDKNEVLSTLLYEEEMSKVIVFVRTKIGADRLTTYLKHEGHMAVALHGDKEFRERMRAVNNFKEGRADILVATDVAARGIDIKGVSHVINFDVPEQYDDYVHRIGRTGRAGESGNALTFVD